MHKLLLLLAALVCASGASGQDAAPAPAPKPEPKAEAKADNKPDEQALLSVLVLWQAAWNDKDLAKTIAVYHPESKMIARLAKEGSKEKYVANTQNIKDQLGDITAVAVGVFSPSGKCWVMKPTYSLKGLVPGTFTVAKDAKGVWMLKSMFITGQGEPELAE